ncbi:MAG: hypothetical protein ACXVYY_01440 [Oryzihumus sp.]
MLALTNKLEGLGWTVPGGFKQTPVVIVSYAPTTGALPAPNTVGISMGPESPTRASQMGDGLREVSYTMFVDIYGESEALALHLASDVKDFLDEVSLPLLDFTDSSTGTATEDLLEVVDCIRVTPQVTVTDEFRRYWQVVKITLTCTFVPA